MDGVSVGDDGRNGVDGFAGRSGGNMHIVCDDIINADKWTIVSRGGNGASGQDGGNGVNGRDGKGISRAAFALDFSPAKPNPKIWQRVSSPAVLWGKSNNSGHAYVAGPTSDEEYLTYSYYAHWCWGKDESYLLYTGSSGQIGGRAGKGGHGGEGGFGGEISVNGERQATMNIDNGKGQNGSVGQDGSTGEPGKNGWDIGYIFRNGWFSTTFDVIGKDENSKLCLKEYKYRNEKSYIYCSYREHLNSEKCYIQVTNASNKHNILNRNATITRATKKELYSVAVRSKAISNSTISQHIQNLDADVIDELNDLSMELSDIQERVKEKCSTVDEEKETINVEVRRQAVFIDNQYTFNQNIKRKSKHISQPVDTTRDLIKYIASNASDCSAWMTLQTMAVSYESFAEIFQILYSNKTKLKVNYTDIICLILNKYRSAVCNTISETKVVPSNKDIYKLEPIENYLMPSTAYREFVYDDLGTLNEFFHKDDEDRRMKLIKTAETMELGSLLYPLKFFITEKSYNDDSFANKSKIFHEKLITFEKRLERLAKCYLVSFETNQHSAILEEIEKRKAMLENQFSAEECEILADFYEHIHCRGISSSAVRELLAIIYKCNIKIYLRNADGQLIPYHDHNPSSLEILYLEHSNDDYKELTVNEEYANLVRTRQYRGNLFSKILRSTDTFYCKEQFDNYLNIVDIYDSDEHPCCDCNRLPANIITDILVYFPNNVQHLVAFRLNKLITYVGKNHILCTMLRRFRIEGIHISFQELSYFINAVLQATVDSSMNLSIFEWIITAKPQNKWANEIFFFQLENYVKRNLTDHSVLQTYVANVKQTEMILLMAVKLSDSHDPVTVDSLEKCLETLNETTVDVNLVENLPLSKWQYVMRELLIEHRLHMLVEWKTEELQKALYYLTCLESNVGPVLVNKLIRIMNLKNGLTSEILLDIFSYLHNQEWTLNELLLTKLARCEARDMKFLIMDLQHSENNERSLETLLNIIKNNLHTSVDILKQLNDFEKQPYIMRSGITFFLNEKKITKWSAQFKCKINLLVGDERKKFIKDNISKALNYISKAVKIKRGFHLRNTQKLAIRLLLSYDHNTLAQISTGEGKSLIVVCAAIFKALCGEKVDIITSSSVLAIRDASMNSDIFDMFEIQVAHNCSEDLVMRKEAYSGSQIIYGDLSNYQRDYLLDRFYDKNIVGNRDYDNLIVDEVDSMLLDRGNNTLYLSHDIPGLDKLESVYLFIWKRVNVSQNSDLQDLEKNIKEAVLYDLDGTLTEQNIEDHLKIRNVEATEIHAWLHSNGIIDENNGLLKHFTNTDSSQFPDKYSKYVNKLSYICTKIKSRVKEIRIPRCLYSFVKLHVDRWIKNAVLASIMEEGHDYVVDVDRTACTADINPNITIIDKGTGTDQSSSQWEEALHQFLQLKHGCKISAQSLKAVFISNVSYFKKYNRLFGLTGTLGTQVERDLLQELYSVHFVNIPTAKPKKFIEDEPIICNTKSDWTVKIVNRTKEILDAERSTLIICETIRDVADLQKAFLSADMRDVLLYKREYEDCTLAQGQTSLAGGRIIIATNLAGRGTDIKINETLNQAGGLHVLLTYLPNNGRIEQQAFGRAARCGCNGSAQLVIIGYGSLLDMRQARDHRELQRISDIKVYYDTRIRAEEQFFDKFAQVYKTLKGEHDNSQLNIIALQRALDRWAFWLDGNGMQLTDKKTCYSFKLFLTAIRSNFSNWRTWSEDAIQVIKLGLHNVQSGKYGEAVKIFDMVIQNEPEFCEAAHYYKAAALGRMLNFEKRPFKNENAVRFEQFVKELLNAEKLFETHRDACNSASAYIQELKQRMKKSFVQIDAYKSQQEILMNIYDFYIRTIRNILGHTVTNRSFECSEINSETSEEIYHGLLSNGVLTKVRVKEFQSQDINEISRVYGVPFEILHNFISDSVGNSIDVNDFQTSLKLKLKLPSVEDFWNILINNNILVNETEFVVIDKTTSDIPETLLQGIEELFIDMKTNDDKRIFKKRIHSDKDSKYLFERGTLKAKMGESQFEKFERNGIFTSNALAHICQERISDPLPAYDQISSEDLLSDDILEMEAKAILLTLAKEGFLKEISPDLYQLQELYDESKLVDIPPYTESIRSVLRYKFAYRIAMENVVRKLEGSNEPVFVDLISEPHMDVMWELINKKIIQPTQVAEHKTSKEIAEILDNFTISKDVKETTTKYIETVLYKLSSILNTLDVPSFTLIPIEKCMDELKVSPLQELHTFTLNSLSYILQAEEKKYTLKMIISTLTVTLLGIVEIVVGLIITLASSGLMTHVGSVLISEGANDLLYTASAWKTGYFSWSQYGKHKLYSTVFSVLTAGIGMVISKGIQFSRFGSKIVMSGTSFAGKEVSTMTGLELIKNTSFKKVGYEMGTILIKKTGESIMRGAVNVGVDYVVETYLQNFCNELCETLLEDINESVANHDVASSLDELCETLGPNASHEKVMFYTNKYFTEPALLSNMISKAQSLIDSVTTGFANAVKKGSTVEGAELLAVIGKVLKYSNYAANLYEIRTSTLSLLDNVNAELRRELQNVSQTKNKSTYTKDDIEEFKLNVILQWRNVLTENARNVFTNNIIKPIINDCTAVMLNYAKFCCKSVYRYAKNQYHVNKLKNKKRNLQKQLEQPVTKEVKTKLIKSYHESLLKLRSRIRDPNLYADIVLENGPMDMVCLQACVSVLPDILQNTNRPVKIVYSTDKGLKQEFCSSGVGEPIVINLQVANNHFANIHGNASSSGDYNCFYQALLTDIPELGGITADDFRNKISKAIRTDESVRSIIEQGHQQYAISQGVYGGHEDRYITTYELHDDLMNANSAFSQSSVSEYTSTRNDVEGIHLSTLANNIRNEGFQGNPINAVQNEFGGLIFLDNRRTVAASTINNRNVSVPVRVFGNNEVLPTELQSQYGGKTAGEAANTRIKRSASFTSPHPVNVGYHPQEVRIRPGCGRKTNSQVSTEQAEFFKRSGRMGYIKYRRGSK